MQVILRDQLQSLLPTSSNCPGDIHLQDIQEAHAGQIVAVFGVDCASGVITTANAQNNTLTHTITDMKIWIFNLFSLVITVTKENNLNFYSFCYLLRVGE